MDYDGYKKNNLIIYGGLIKWTFPFPPDDFCYNSKVKPTKKDHENWKKWGKLQKSVSKLYPDGAAFYAFYRSNEGGLYFYDYQKAYKQDSNIKRAVDKVFKRIKERASFIVKSEDKWYTISTSLTLVKTIHMNWMLALGGHYFGVVADIKYSSFLKKYIMDYTVIAIDRYNFDGGGKNFFGIPDSANGRFVTLGWATSFTSIGLMVGTKTWKK